MSGSRLPCPRNTLPFYLFLPFIPFSPVSPKTLDEPSADLHLTQCRSPKNFTFTFFLWFVFTLLLECDGSSRSVRATVELGTMHSTKESTDQYLSPSLSLSLLLFLVAAIYPSQFFDLGNLWVYGLCCVIWYWVPVYGFDAFIFPFGSLILQFDGFQFFA